MNEDFIPFELAVKLKEKGFRERVKGYYSESKGLSVCNTPMNSNALDNEFSAPTISQVLKWLREEKKLHIMVDIWKVNVDDIIYKWGYDIVDLTTTKVIGCDTQCANAYEQAALAGIEYVLDNLI